MWNQEYGNGREQEEQFEFYGEMEEEYQGEGDLNEMEEMELAAELLSVTNDREMEQFLGSLIKKAGSFIKGPVGQALGGALKGIAKKALPVVGGAIGSFVAPGVGTAIGSSLGSAAGKLFGLELEGMSNEDREFEVARRFVRLASTAAKTAASAPPSIPPQQVVQKAISAAARTHAPGLLTSTTQGESQQQPWAGNGGNGGNGRTGRWIRRGKKIIVYGV